MAAGVTTAIGLVALVQYLTGAALPGWDTLLAEPWDTTGTSHPGRMAPNTAVCFLLCAPACLRVPASVAGWLASSALTLATVAIAGYTLGMAPAYGWGGLTEMALHTAIGFAVAAAVLISRARVAGWHVGPAVVIGVAAVLGEEMMRALVAAGLDAAAGWAILAGFLAVGGVMAWLVHAHPRPAG